MRAGPRLLAVIFGTLLGIVSAGLADALAQS